MFKLTGKHVSRKTGLTIAKGTAFLVLVILMLSSAASLLANPDAELFERVDEDYPDSGNDNVPTYDTPSGGADGKNTYQPVIDIDVPELSKPQVFYLSAAGAEPQVGPRDNTVVITYSFDGPEVNGQSICLADENETVVNYYASEYSASGEYIGPVDALWSWVGTDLGDMSTNNASQITVTYTTLGSGSLDITHDGASDNTGTIHVIEVGTEANGTQGGVPGNRMERGGSPSSYSHVVGVGTVDDAKDGTAATEADTVSHCYQTKHALDFSGASFKGSEPVPLNGDNFWSQTNMGLWLEDFSRGVEVRSVIDKWDETTDTGYTTSTVGSPDDSPYQFPDTTLYKIPEITATLNSEGNVLLSWDGVDQSSGIIGFIVYRSYAYDVHNNGWGNPDLDRWNTVDNDPNRVINNSQSSPAEFGTSAYVINDGHSSHFYTDTSVSDNSRYYYTLTCVYAGEANDMTWNIESLYHGVVSNGVGEVPEPEEPQNNPPVIMTIDVTEAYTGEQYRVNYEATDEAENTLMWSMISDAEWLSINSASGVLSGTPSVEDGGIVGVAVRVVDVEGASDETVFDLNVIVVEEEPVEEPEEEPVEEPEEEPVEEPEEEPVEEPEEEPEPNTPPMIVTDPVREAYSRELYYVEYVAYDVEGDEVVWSLVTDAEWLSMDPTTGVLYGTPSNDDAGTYDVTISLDDSIGGSDTQDFELVVYFNLIDSTECLETQGGIVGNRRETGFNGLVGNPVIGAGSIRDAADGTEGNVDYTTTHGYASERSGDFSGASGDGGEPMPMQVLSNDDGDHNVWLQVNLGTWLDEFSYDEEITVVADHWEERNLAGYVGSATGIPANEDNRFEHTITLHAMPEVTTEIMEHSNELTWTGMPASSGVIGFVVYRCSADISDNRGWGSTNNYWMPVGGPGSVIINNSQASPATSDLAAYVENTGGTITFVDNEATPGLDYYYALTCVFEGYNNGSVWNIESLYRGPSTGAIVVIPNTPPTITTLDVNSATAEIYYLVNYDAADPNDDTLSWNLQTDASWLSMDVATGVLRGTPQEEDVGTYSVTVTVTDGEGGMDSSSFTLTVFSDNTAPTINMNWPVDDAYAHQYYELQLIAEDAEGDIITWTFSEAAEWLNTDASGLVYGTPRVLDWGEHMVVATATDEHGAATSVSFVINVNIFGGSF